MKIADTDTPSCVAHVSAIPWRGIGGFLLGATPDLRRARRRLSCCLALSALLHLPLLIDIHRMIGLPGARSPAGAKSRAMARSALKAQLTPRVSPGSMTVVAATPSRKMHRTARAQPEAPVASPSSSETGGLDGAGQAADPLAEDQAFWPEPYYYSAQELTRKPTVVKDVELVFPPLSKEMASEKTILRLLIGESGGVEKVIVEQSGLPAIFQELVILSFSQAVFAPGEFEQIPVKSQMRIEVFFAGDK